MRQLDHMHVRLPPLPTTVGTSAAFRTNLREACEVFLGRFPLLRPLVVPLRVTMLVVPGLESNTEKDLDNIALDVLPAIQEVFKPPLDRISDPEPPLLSEPEKGDQEQASGVTRTVPERVGVTSFQVIEADAAADTTRGRDRSGSCSGTGRTCTASGPLQRRTSAGSSIGSSDSARLNLTRQAGSALGRRGVPGRGDANAGAERWPLLSALEVDEVGQGLPHIAGDLRLAP